MDDNRSDSASRGKARGQYPKRPPFFAYRAFRLMTKTCLAQDIGPEAVLLLAVIAFQEDAKRYRGPVSFFNGQLLPVLGFRKWERLKKAREAAVDAGWLHYEQDGTRKPGRYWITLPDGLEELADAPIDERLPPNSEYERGYKDGYREGMNAATKPEQRRNEQGEPPTLTPIPDSDSPPKTKQAAFNASAVEFPSELETPAFRDAWLNWVDYRQSKRKPISERACRQQLKTLAELGASEAVKRIETAIANDWQGVVFHDRATARRDDFGRGLRAFAQDQEDLDRDEA